MPKYARSASMPSIGFSPYSATMEPLAHASRVTLAPGTRKFKKRRRGDFIWQGRYKAVTFAILNLPWNVWFQTILLTTIIYKYVVNLLLGYYLTNSSTFLLDVTLHVTEVLFVVDVVVHCLHAYWPPVRLHMRIYMRTRLALIYDLITLIPISTIFMYKPGFELVVRYGRWLPMSRVYRIFSYFKQANEKVQNGSRKLLYMIENVLSIMLTVHLGACLLYHIHSKADDKESWYKLGYPEYVNSHKIKFDNYIACWYYCSCRLFNVIFGDAFPLLDADKWLTSFLMIIGYVVFRFQYIGIMTWELVLENTRRSLFIDQYHHMVSFLKLRNAPTWLLDQAKEYKKRLWTMKDGVLSCNELQRLPLALQMELVFDINIVHFHNSLLFREADEAFLRQISLLMKHELYLAGQYIWSQNVVKMGMICIKRGVIEMLSDEDDESPIIAFKEGTVLGELSLFYSIPAKVTVKAATYVELQVLRRTDFMRVAEEHPVMLSFVKNKIKERLRKSRQRQEAIEEYDKGDSRLIRTRYRPMKVLKDNLAGIEEEDPTFVDDSHMYYKDENNERQPKFTTEYLELYQMSNKVTTIDSPKICLRSNFPWILQPNTAFTHMFDVAHFLMVLYLCGLSPYYALQTHKTDFEIAFSTLVVAGLLLNIYIQLTTAIIEKNVRKETVQEIAEVKMSSVGFYLDILSVFPLYIFSDTFDPTHKSVIGQVVKLFPMLQVWHIWDYCSRWMQNFSANLKLLVLVKHTLLVVICCYWSGCLLYLYACPRRLCFEKSWMSQLIYWETKVFMTTNARHERPFVSAFAFGSSVFTLTGSSDLAPGVRDLLVVVCIFTIGGFLYCFYTAKICSIYVLETRRKLKFKGCMTELFYFLSVNRVSGKIKSRVKKFFCVQWYYNNSVSTKEIFQDMSTNIQQEVLSVEMVETLLFCPIFQGCNRDFLQTVTASSRTIVLPDNEVVQHAADIGRDMYILQKGHCNLLNHNAKVERSIGPGNHFGAIEMLFGLPKVYTVMTTTNCILLHVEYRTLVQCWGTFPDISHPIITVIEDPEILEKAKCYEEAKPLTGKLDSKTNRIAQEIKESFVVMTDRAERAKFMKVFDCLGIMRFLKYLFIPGCITPHGIFLKTWCALRFLIAWYYVTVIPYNMATKQHMHQGIFYYADIFLYVDVIVMAYVAYYNENSILVTHPLLTVSRYLKHAFLLDAISIFPFEQLVRIVNENNNLDMFRLNRMLLLTRITGAFSYLESDIMQVNFIVILLKFLPIAITFVNIATACLFVNSCSDTYLPKNATSSYILVECTRVLSVSNRPDRKYAVTEYAYTFFWAFEIFVACGCTPVNVSNNVEIWLTIVLQIVGSLYFAFMFAYVSSTRTASTHALLKHSEKTKDLANFLYQANVDPNLTARTLKYFEYVWKRTNGSNAQQICRRLHSALMEDTLVFMYEKALREVPLFGKVERSFIRVFTQHLDEMYFLKGETVIQCMDVQQYIYIIYRGKVDVLTSYNEMITCMGPGGMFGNFSGQPMACSSVTIFASRSLDLLVISGPTFFNLIKYYPKIQEPLNKAFLNSKDYILPITMNYTDDSSSEGSEYELYSLGSVADSRSESSKDGTNASAIYRSQSQSNVSQSKSAASVGTYYSYLSMDNIFRPGSMMFQGFLTKHGDILIDPVKCRKKYFKKSLWVWADALSNAPLEFIGFFFSEPTRMKVIHYCRINKLIRLSYLIEFYNNTAAELTNNLTILQATMTLIVVVVIIHTFTCFWLISMMAYSPVTIIRTLKMHLIDEVTPQRRWDYVSSLCVIISELTTTGGDEFVITDIIPMIILSACLISGKMLASVVVATAIQIAYATKYAMIQYEKSTTELIDMLKNQGLSSYQLKKFVKYVQQLWATERGRQLPVLLSQTPYVRRCILMSAMFGHHLRNCHIFSDTGEAFLRQLAGALEYTTFFPGNYIVVAGDSEARMYWVTTGIVSVVSVRPDLTETTHEFLHAGDMFGLLQGLNRGIPHCFSYRAETKVSVVSLALDNWLDMVQFFPDAKKIIIESAEVLFTTLV
ncbi:uncharacterized protein LOC128673815 isoform X2 [Plodia interpunctella]|uniref:uncharacterized protein LOC128673815 isoform X2 n=1 Tax=Plodia interpunctella TaxID=58824 RepID=UPI002368D3EC|nr:uncharacterized protein LOC128673815 isoform X2 [Plodia interpunctella]